MKIFRSTSLLLLFCSCLVAFGAVPDSIDLKEVVVVGRSVKQDVIPVQTLSGDELHRLNSNSVADALRYFAGVQVKDYGGVGV